MVLRPVRPSRPPLNVLGRSRQNCYENFSYASCPSYVGRQAAVLQPIVDTRMIGLFSARECPCRETRHAAKTRSHAAASAFCSQARVLRKIDATGGIDASYCSMTWCLHFPRFPQKSKCQSRRRRVVEAETRERLGTCLRAIPC
jgi:hypothetical protein